MKSKKIRVLLISLISMMMVVTFANKSKAVTPLATPVYFGVEEFRTGTTPENMGYAINNPLGNGSTTESIVGTKIWNIKKYLLRIDKERERNEIFIIRYRMLRRSTYLRIRVCSGR